MSESKQTKWFYERNDYFLDHPINKYFEEVLRMSEAEFESWCIELRDVIVHNWDKNGTPPIVGQYEKDIIDQFSQMSSYPVHKFLKVDEYTGKRDVIYNTSTIGIVVNSWFPTMMKTEIGTSLTATPKSIYKYFAKPETFKRFLVSSHRQFKRDSFYTFSSSVKSVGNIKEDLIVTNSAVEWIKQFEKQFRKAKVYDYWLQPIDDTKTYTGYLTNLKDHRNKFLFLTAEELKELNDIIPEGSKTNIHHRPAKIFALRLYRYGTKIFPLGLKAFRISYCNYAVNFPPLTAKLIYETYTEHIKEKRPIVIYDPSAGWGGRILGAMCVSDDRLIHYVGTDPNTDHNTDHGRTKYHEVADFFNSKTPRSNPIFSHKNSYEIFQDGSEVISNNTRFKKYKGRIDLIFTSPPYFAKEQYSKDPTQSCHKFSQYDTWREGFLRPTLETCVEYLADDRYLLWNVSQVQFGSSIYDIPADSKAILEELGMEYINTIKMAVQPMPGANRANETGDFDETFESTLDGVVSKKVSILKATTRNSCKVAGRILKFEPVLVFYKRGKGP